MLAVICYVVREEGEGQKEKTERKKVPKPFLKRQIETCNYATVIDYSQNQLAHRTQIYIWHSSDTAI